MTLIDISSPLSVDTVIYPGDPKVRIKSEKTLQKDGVVVSKITMSLHTGTHIDAPLHIFPAGNPWTRYLWNLLGGML